MPNRNSYQLIRFWNSIILIINHCADGIRQQITQKTSYIPVARLALHPNRFQGPHRNPTKFVDSYMYICIPFLQSELYISLL